MNTPLLTLLQAAADPSAQPQGGGMGSMLLMMGALIAVFYFFMIRPQQKRQKELQKFRNELKKGDKVVTIGGIHGYINSVSETSVIVTIAENVNVSFEKSAIIKDNSDMPQQQ